MTGLQKFLKAILPARWSQRLEDESRAWVLECPQCAHSKSLWDAGGVRFAAAGESRVPGHCAPCGQVRVLRLYRRPD